MGNKDLAMSKVTRQLKNKELLFSHMRKELDSKSTRIKNLEAIIAKTGSNHKLFA